jgi:class 3 adenylate cyclase
MLGAVMPQLPSGTVTFVFSDIEGSTALLKRLGEDTYAEALRIHRRLMRETFARFEGQEIDTQGDAFFYSFVRARQAVAAAVEVQRAHEQQKWPDGVSVRIRLGLHTGEPAVGDEGYTGLDVVRAARIAAVARGGQVLLSDTTRVIVSGSLPDGVELRSLGEQRLRDIDRPEPLHELHIAGLAPAPPARSADAVTPSDDAAEDLADPLARLPDRIREATGRFAPLGTATSRLIEERVLGELQKAFEARDSGPEPQAEPAGSITGAPSVADEIAKLRELRDAGAMTEEQYARAVDQALAARE